MAAHSREWGCWARHQRNYPSQSSFFKNSMGKDKVSYGASLSSQISDWNCRIAKILVDLVENIGRDLSIYRRKAVRRVLRNPGDKMAAHSREWGCWARYQRNCPSQSSFFKNSMGKDRVSYGASLSSQISNWNCRMAKILFDSVEKIGRDLQHVQPARHSEHIAVQINMAMLYASPCRTTDGTSEPSMWGKPKEMWLQTNK